MLYGYSRQRRTIGSVAATATTSRLLVSFQVICAGRVSPCVSSALRGRLLTCTGDLDLKREYLADRYLTDGNSLRDLPALTTYQRRGSLQLWQFLIALLENPANTSFIAWTGRGLEFKLIEPEEVSNTKVNLGTTVYCHWVCPKSIKHVSQFPVTGKLLTCCQLVDNKSL